jgi:histidyl-tRNA synthetase
MKQIIPSLKGTRDYYPEDMAVRTWLYSTIKEVSESFGYQEYEAPFLETLELYAAKSGEELVNTQSYVFPDRGGDLITLRPELTPSLARMIAMRQRQLVYPLRWWQWGPFWRYERPQKGRTREFFQWNIDLIGVDSPEADAEMLAVIATFFRKVGLTPKDAVIRVNNRKLIDAELAAMGIPAETRPEVSNLIDRRGKMTPEDWDAYAYDLGLQNTLLDRLKETLADPDLWQKSDELVRLFSAADAMGISEYIRYDANTIRGLAYYTGTVFEAFQESGEIRRSILGGGRYDRLMEDVGGDPLPAVGFAMGNLVITLVLESLGLLPKDAGLSPATVLVTVFDEESFPASFAFATELRQGGLKTAIYPQAARLPKQFKYADRMGMKLAVVLGPDELQSGKVAVKNLQTGDQVSINRKEAVAAIRKLLENPPSS